jgi:hypothetical protein
MVEDIIYTIVWTYKYIQIQIQNLLDKFQQRREREAGIRDPSEVNWEEIIKEAEEHNKKPRHGLGTAPSGTSAYFTLEDEVLEHSGKILADAHTKLKNSTLLGYSCPSDIVVSGCFTGNCVTTPTGTSMYDNSYVPSGSGEYLEPEDPPLWWIPPGKYSTPALKDFEPTGPPEPEPPRWNGRDWDERAPQPDQSACQYRSIGGHQDEYVPVEPKKEPEPTTAQLLVGLRKRVREMTDEELTNKYREMWE